MNLFRAIDMAIQAGANGFCSVGRNGGYTHERGMPSCSFPCTEQHERYDVVMLLHESEKTSLREEKKRIVRFSIIASLGVFCAVIVVLVALFFWTTTPDDTISSMGKMYPPRINTPTGKSVIVPPAEGTNLKGQAEILSVIASSVGKNYSIQISAYPETKINEATEFVSELRKRLPDVYMEKVYIQGRGVWNRILVGHFATFEEASTYMKEEKVFKEYPGSFVKLTSEG